MAVQDLPVSDDDNTASGSLKFSRKTLLVGAGLGSLGIQALAGAGRAFADGAREHAAATRDNDPIVTGDQFPIGLFWPPPPLQTGLARYQEIRDAGFTFVLSGNYLNDRQSLDYALSFCDQTDLQMLVADPDVTAMLKNFTIGGDGDLHLSEPDAQQILRSAITHYTPGGWHLSGGALRIDGGSSDGSVGLTKDGSSWTDYSLDFTLQLINTTVGIGYSQAGWVIRAKDSGSGYVWLLSDNKLGEDDAPGFLTKAIFDGGALISAEVKPLQITIKPEQPYKITTTVAGNKIITKLDGTEIDSTTDTRFGSGRVGFREAGQEAAIFDDVQVTDASGKKLFSDDFSGDLSAWEPPAGSGHTSFAGLVLYDEPSGSKVDDVAAATRLMRDLDLPYLPYVNLLPGLGDQYLQQAKTIGAPLLSFDRYPRLTDSIDSGYFANWADVSAAAKKLGVPSWTFIQSVGYNNHAVPSAAGMLWQINISLAYGCKGIQYFTYWTPDPARGEGFHNALITVEGRRTARYDGARKINNDYLQPVGQQLLPLQHRDTFSVNLDQPPTGLPQLADDPLVAGATGDATVIGRFSRDDHDYLLLANYSATRTGRVRLSWQPGVNHISIFDPDSGKYRRVGSDTRHRLPPGGGALLRAGRADR